jgi:hypothetical protein
VKLLDKIECYIWGHSYIEGSGTQCPFTGYTYSYCTCCMKRKTTKGE